MKIKLLFAAIVFLVMQKAFTQVSRFSVQGKTCVESTLTFVDESAVQATSWTWSFGDGNTSNLQNPEHQYTDSGYYTIQLSIISGEISSTNSVTIYISKKPKVYFWADTALVWYSSYSRVFIDSSVVSNPIANYTWDFGDNSNKLVSQLDSTLYKYAEKGSYEIWLKVTDNMGCVDSASQTITISNRFFVPNVFTPNNDLINDKFIVTSNGISLFSIEIYSRWGNLIFKREGHQQIDWDGRLPDGSLVKPGTYYYVINAKNGTATYEPEKGFITVFY